MEEQANNTNYPGTPPARNESKTSVLISGLLFYFILGIGILWLTAKEFLFNWWWLIGIGSLFLIFLILIPRVRTGLEKSLPRKRVALIVFGLIPVLILLLGGVFIIREPFDIIVLRIVFLLLVCLFPAVLYYLFVSTRRYSLLNEFVSNLNRLGILKPKETPNTLEQHRSVYGYLQKFEALYGTLPSSWITSILNRSGLMFGEGSQNDTNSQGFISIFATQTTLPVVLTTIFITIGWMITMPPLQYSGGTTLNGTAVSDSTLLNNNLILIDTAGCRPERINNDNLMSDTLSVNENSATSPIDRIADRAVKKIDERWLNVLQPIETPINFAFLGAYFFSFQMLFRRYVRRDLGASAYVSILLRITLAVIGTWVVTVALKTIPGINPTENQLLVMGFIIGVFPRVAMQIILAAGRSVFKFIVPNLKTELPISDLDGLTVWHEVRLEEEDIENIPNMATADIVELIINTRIPPGRIIDWTDQAILYTQLGPPSDKSGGTSNRDKLRSYGIKDASSLLEAYEQSKKRSSEDSFEKLLNDGYSMICSLVDTVKTNPNLELILKWRNYEKES